MVPRGRPRSFDRDAALDKVMKVFWAKGYECAQINDFTTAIGITPPSAPLLSMHWKMQPPYRMAYANGWNRAQTALSPARRAAV